MTAASFIPTDIDRALALARIYAASSIVTPAERAEAAARAGALDVPLAEALVGDMFVRILAGAARGIDPSTSLAYFSIINGTLRATREAPLALCRGMIEEIDERLVPFAALQELEHIVSGYSDADPGDAVELDRVRFNWRAADDVGTPGKHYALQVRAAERRKLLEGAGFDPETPGYKAAVCAVRRKGERTWHVRIFDVEEAHARGFIVPENEWWTRFTDDALRYQARQPLLRAVFPDILGNLPVEDEARVAPPPAASSPPAEAAGALNVQDGVEAV